jgi:hypothetical protein
MLTDFLVIDDVFDNPDDLLFKAKQSEYFDVFSHPDYWFEASKKITYYPGMRTKLIDEYDTSLYKFCNDTIVHKMAEKALGFSRNDIQISYNTRLYFHYMTVNDVLDENSYHEDPALFAGVVYLNKNPPPDSGTIVIKDGKEIVVENRYNRLVLYRADLRHSVQNTFGQGIYDGRLTLTVFFDKVTYNLCFNKLKYINSLDLSKIFSA